MFILTYDLTEANIWFNYIPDIRFKQLVDLTGVEASWLYILHASISESLNRSDEAEEYIQNLLEVLIDNCPLEIYEQLGIEDNDTMFMFHEFLYNSYMNMASLFKNMLFNNNGWREAYTFDYEILHDEVDTYIIKIYTIKEE